MNDTRIETQSEAITDLQIIGHKKYHGAIMPNDHKLTETMDNKTLDKAGQGRNCLSKLIPHHNAQGFIRNGELHFIQFIIHCSVLGL